MFTRPARRPAALSRYRILLQYFAGCDVHVQTRVAYRVMSVVIITTRHDRYSLTRPIAPTPATKFGSVGLAWAGD